MSNMYFDPHADDDILQRSTNPSKKRHAINGEPCPRCGGKVHSVHMPKDVPPEVLDQIAEMMEQVPDELIEHTEIQVVRETPGKTKLVGSFMEFTTRVNSLNQTGPLVRALAEVLDDMTQGQVTARYRVYKVERELIIAHTLVKRVNSILDSIRTMDTESGKAAAGEGSTIVEMIEKLLTANLDHLHETVDRYEKVCAESGVRADPHMVEVGLPTDPYAPLAQVTMQDWFDEGMSRLVQGE